MTSRAPPRRPSSIPVAPPEDREPAEYTFVLVVSSHAGITVVSLPQEGQVVVGRGDECDVVLPDDSVSRRHARLTLGPEMWVEDLGSTNGTMVQGMTLRAGQRLPVGVGSTFELGATSIVLQRTRVVSPPPPPAEAHQAPSAASTGGPQGDGPVYADPAMHRLYGLLQVIAPSPLSVLILGETGVGKELYARAVHDRSPRRGGQYLQLNCAALPETILDGELFGYEKGAFTGAMTSKPGLFESANGGTVFLDEVGELPLAIQAKLLRVLETGDVIRLGSRKSSHVDVRFVSATNRDLPKAVREGTFRADLYFRLNGVSVTVPPLRKRVADVLPLAEHFLAKAARRLARAVPRLSEASQRALEGHTWPGNVRELRNTVERAAVLAQGAELEPQDLLFAEGLEPDEVPAPLDATSTHRMPTLAARLPTMADVTLPPPTDAPSQAALAEEAKRLQDVLRAMEKQRILEALQEAAGNQSRAAKILGISRYALIHRLDVFGLARPRKGREPG